MQNEKTLNVDQKDPLEQLRQMSVHLEADFQEGHDAAKLVLNNSKGTGSISTFHTFPGLSLRCYNISFKEKMQFEIDGNLDNPVYLLYCYDGHYYHSFDSLKNAEKINRGYSVIVSAAAGKKNIIRFPINVRIKISVIILDESELSLKHQTKQPKLVTILKEILDEVSSGSSFKFIGNAKNTIDAHAKLLIENDRTDIIGKLITEAALLYTLASQLEDRKNYLERKSRTTYLKDWEIEKIIGISDLLKREIMTTIKVHELAKMCNMHERKLQEGFRYLYGNSVNQFMRNFRLNKAKELFETTNLTVKEVAAEIGIPNKSYFAKLFKETFGILPRDLMTLHESNGWSFELSYKSKVRASVTNKMILELVNRSNSVNIENSLTGCLVHYENEFFQFIEGPKKQVLALYEVIKMDKRHHDIQLLWKGARRKRVFKNWGMALVSEIENPEVIHIGENLGVDLEILSDVKKKSELLALKFWEQIRNRIRMANYIQSKHK